ncbi:hypothetical protein SDC9_161129 [bioreactor metagenome]|uniref:Uncharacterized protein n=1 Tax=bioreactor metagenome TaxID=1076179 RepID=A0A645FNN0_9ZZZZ
MRNLRTGRRNEHAAPLLLVQQPPVHQCVGRQLDRKKVDAQQFRQRPQGRQRLPRPQHPALDPVPQITGKLLMQAAGSVMLEVAKYTHLLIRFISISLISIL